MANESQNTDQQEKPKSPEEGGGGGFAQMQQQIQSHMADVGASILKYEAERAKDKQRQKVEKNKLMSFRGERLKKDADLRRIYDITRGSGYAQQMGKAFLIPYDKHVRKLYKQYYDGIKKEDNEERDKAFAALRLLKQEIDFIKTQKAEYGELMFGGPGGKSKLSKGCSVQQISIADQLYTQNPDLVVTFGTEQHVKDGVLDFFGLPLKVNEQYAVVEKLDGRPIFVSMKEGLKDLFIPPMAKALEYQEIRKEQADLASEAAANQQTPNLDVGSIAYKMEKLFLERETVLAFAHDDMLEDGSTFKKDLYNHKDLVNIKYADFNLSDFDANRDGVIDEFDREAVVSAITDPDSKFFNIELLRELVTDYFTKKVYAAWGKNLGFEDDWLQNLEIHRVKLNMARFNEALETAKFKGLETFMFDGEQYITDPKKPINQPAKQEEVKNEIDTDYMEKYNLQ